MGSKEYPGHDAVPHEQTKVGDSVAVYHATPSAKPKKTAPAVRLIAGIEAPDDVWEFAGKHQLIPHLETAIRLARESFRDLRSLRLTFEPDPETPNLDGIAIEAKVGGTHLEWESQYLSFQKRFLHEIPDEFHDKICLLLWSA